MRLHVKTKSYFYFPIASTLFLPDNQEKEILLIQKIFIKSSPFRIIQSYYVFLITFGVLTCFK